MPDVAQKQLSEQIDSDWYGNVDELQDKGYTGKEGEFDDIDLSDAFDSDLQNQEAGSGGAGVDGAGDLKPPEAGSLSDVDARKWYLNSEAIIPELIDKTKPLEQQARQAVDLRNQFRTQARDAMSNRSAAEGLFGSNPNMSWGEIVEKYQSRGFTGDALYQEIINAAQRSNPGVNQSLGVFPK